MNSAVELVAGLDALRQEGALCDVELQAENQTLPAHRAVLAAASPFFKAMFIGNFKEATEKVIQVKDISFSTLQEIVSSIYTTHVNITNENVQDIFCAAHVMELERIYKKCKRWMLENIQTSTCLLYLHLAEQYEIDDLENAMKKYILANFCDIVQQEKELFNTISQQALCRYLSSDALRQNYNEMAVYRAAKDWILTNDIAENSDIYEIMKNIRFTLIYKDELSNINSDNFITSHKQCHDMVSDAMNYHMVDLYAQPFYEGNVHPRGQLNLLVFHHLSRPFHNGIGREMKHYICGIDENLIVSSDSRDAYHHSIEPFEPHIVYHSLMSVCINNFLFVFGVSGVSSEGYQNFTKRYDASINVWVDLAPVPADPMVGACIARSEKNIFLFGGMTKDHFNSIGIVETDHKPQEETEIISQGFTYAVDKNSWSTCPKMPLPILCSAAACLGGDIYVTGGCYPSDEHVAAVANVYLYDVKAKVMRVRPPMHQPRCEHIAEVVNNKLYVIGGRCPVGEYMRRNIRKVPEIEAFDPATNQWTITHEHDQPYPPPNNFVRRNGYPFGSCSFVIGDKIFVVGGGASNERAVLVYDTVEHRMVNQFLIHVEQSAKFERMICAPLTMQ